MNKIKRQHTEYKKIFADNETDKGLISKIYKQLMKLSLKNKKMGRRSTKIFLQRRHTGGQQTHENMLNTVNDQRNANQN